MMFTRLGVLVLGLSLVFSLFLPTVLPAQTPAAPDAARAVAAAANDFGFRLFAQLQLGRAPNQNIFISPSSLSLALAMTYNGAAASTRAGMAQALGVQGMSLQALNTGQAALLRQVQSADPKVTCTIADALWVQNGFQLRRDFLQRNARDYQATIKNTDISGDAGVREINAWVDHATAGKITDLLHRGDLNASTRFVLTNAVYFKGAWTSAFQKAATREQDFTRGDGTVKKVPLMAQQGIFPYLQQDDFQVIALPYGDRQFSMYILLPNADKSLRDLLPALTPQHWQQWLARMHPTEALIALPRFKASYDAEMSQALADLGMREAFTPAADFSGIDGNRDLYIKLVRHKAVLEVSEEGTVAAAATGTVMRDTAMRIAPVIPKIIVDRPFICAIVERQSGNILFLGSIVDPQT
jgi:serpin B